MKKFRRVLSVIVAMALVFGTMAVAADFSDVPSDKAYYQPVKILNAFGIITGYDDGTFGPEKDVTRAEFSAMLMRALASGGIGSSDPAGTPFTDLDGALWAVSDIRTAYDLKIVNGTSETTFAPLDNVTYEQALKMIVCALNYGAQAEEIQNANPGNPWYYGYMQVANKLKLTDGMSVVLGAPAKRWEIGQMIYNSLEVEMLEKVEVTGGGVMYRQTDDTLLESKLGYYKSRGEVYADGSNTMAPDGQTAREGYALIYDTADKKAYTFLKGDVSLAGMLGKTTDYYYEVDELGTKKLVVLVSSGESGNNTVVSSDDIVSVTGSASAGFSIVYYPSATATRTTTVKTAANPVVSINGRVISAPTAEDIAIECGTVELIMSGGDYNKINIESYETYVVKSINTTDKYIIDVNRTAASNNTLTIDENDSNKIITMKNTSGSAVSLTGISQYNVLSVRRGTGASGRESLDITVSNKNVSGVIREIDLSGRTVEVGGTKYNISNYLVKYGSTILNGLAAGDTYKCYIDKDGAIAHMIKTTSNSTYYGYIAAADADNKGNIRIALISSKTPTIGAPYLAVASKVKIDGETYSSKDEILSALAKGADVSDSAGIKLTNLDGNGNGYSQLVKYTVNSSGEISSIETAYLGANEDGNDETVFQGFGVPRKSGEKMTYKGSSYDFIGASNSDKFRINSSTQVFIVPEVRSDYDAYGRKTSSYFKTDKSYIIEAYGVTGSLNIAAAVVVYEEKGAVESIDHTTPMFIITNIKQTINSDSNECDMVTGYQISTSGSVTDAKTYYTDQLGVISDKFSVGDVIMFTTNNKGYITDGNGTAKCLVKKFSPTDFKAGTEGEGDRYDSATKYNQVYAGLLLGSDSSTGTQMFDLALVDKVADCETAEPMSFNASSSVAYFTYDTTATTEVDKVVKQSGAVDLASFASYNETKDTETPAAAQIFVYKYANAVRMVYIVK